MTDRLRARAHRVVGRDTFRAALGAIPKGWGVGAKNAPAQDRRGGASDVKRIQRFFEVAG